MPSISYSALRTVFIVAAVVLVVFLLIGGNFLWGISILAIAAVLGLGALLYNRLGPPER